MIIRISRDEVLQVIREKFIESGFPATQIGPVLCMQHNSFEPDSEAGDPFDFLQIEIKERRI